MSRTLLLNASFEPLAVVSLRRAVLLVLAEKAEVVSENGELFRSAKRSIAAPAVIRLKRYVRIPYRARVPLTRRALAYRDNGTCQFSHCLRFVGNAGTVDHVRPQSSYANRADAHCWENVVWACAKCNAKKGSKTLEQLGWSIVREPSVFTTRAWFIVGITVEPAWKPYLAAA